MPKTIATIIGARPQFIKATPLSQALVAAKMHEILIHTGQHYDEQMSDIFFQELNLPRPHHHLAIGSGSHGAQTGRMLEKIESVFAKEKPDIVLVYGDTNSTLAGALAAAKMGISIAHVEAGLRSYSRTMPEEINRVVTDHLSTLLFCPSPNAENNLAQEGITQGVHLTGDIMVDALNHFLPAAESRDALDKFNLKAKEFFLLTVHRAANADNPALLTEIFSGCGQLSKPVLFPMHPRTKKIATTVLTDLPQSLRQTIQVVDPVGYLDMLCLEKNAQAILTDSGGVQKEAFVLQTPCITLRSETEWVETLEGGWNQLVSPNAGKIVEAVVNLPAGDPPGAPYGDGNTAEKIVSILKTI